MYQRLNAICVENVYPLSLMKDMLVHLAKGRIFTKLDLQEEGESRRKMSEKLLSTVLWDVSNFEFSLLDCRAPPPCSCS